MPSKNPASGKKSQTYYLYSDGTISVRRPGPGGVLVNMVCHAPNRAAARKIFDERKSKRKTQEPEGPRTVPSRTIQGDTSFAVPALPRPERSNRLSPMESAEFSQPGINLSIMGVTLWLASGNHLSVRANGEILIVPAIGPSATDRMLRENDPGVRDLPARTPVEECLPPDPDEV